MILKSLCMGRISKHSYYMILEWSCDPPLSWPNLNCSNPNTSTTVEKDTCTCFNSMCFSVASSAFTILYTCNCYSLHVVTCTYLKWILKTCVTCKQAFKKLQLFNFFSYLLFIKLVVLHAFALQKVFTMYLCVLVTCRNL